MTKTITASRFLDIAVMVLAADPDLGVLCRQDPEMFDMVAHYVAAVASVFFTKLNDTAAIEIVEDISEFKMSNDLN